MSHPPSLRLLVFDLDGTLVDSTRDLATAVNRALARVLPGAPALAVDVVRGFVGEGATLLVRRCLDHVGRTDAPTEALLDAFLEAYGGCLLDTTHLFPGVEETLAWLRARREPPALAVLTNKPGEMSRTILDGLGVGAHFARVLGSGDGSPRKPDPDGLVALMHQFGAAPHATALVGDSRIDVLTARAAGVVTVGVEYGLDPAGLRAAGPDAVVADMDALRAYLERSFMLG